MSSLNMHIKLTGESKLIVGVLDYSESKEGSL